MLDKKNPFVNVDFSKDLELLDSLDQMVETDDTDRSKFMRKLVRQEKLRREGKLPEQLPLPIEPKAKKNAPATAEPLAA